MQHYTVADRNVIADKGWMSITSNVDNRTVLNISAITNADGVDVTTHNHVEPKACPLANMDIANNASAGGEKGGLSNLRCRSFVLEYHEI
jgi:hypothetical protein